MAAPSAQPAAGSGSLVLQLRDSQTGYGVAGTIQVTSAHPGENTSTEAKTDPNGKLILRLPPGQYQVAVTAPGYTPQSSEFPITAGQNSEMGWVLDPIKEPADLKRAKSIGFHGAVGYGGYVVDATSFQPIAGVVVRDRNSGVEVTTNARGFFLLRIPLKRAPGDPCRDSIRSFAVSAPGYKREVRNNIALADDTMSFINFVLPHGSGTIDASAPDIWDETSSAPKNQKSEPAPAWWDAEASQQPPGKEVKQWQALGPKIEKTLQEHGIQCPGQHLQIQIVDVAQIQGGPQVALVGYCPGGAYTERILAMQLEDGEPVLSKYYPNPEKPENLEFAQGASAVNTVDVRLAPEDDAIYDIQYSTDGCMRLLTCRVKAYSWAPDTRTFDVDRALTRKATQGYCRHVQNQHLKTSERNAASAATQKK